MNTVYELYLLGKQLEYSIFLFVTLFCYLKPVIRFHCEKLPRIIW